MSSSCVVGCVPFLPILDQAMPSGDANTASLQVIFQRCDGGAAGFASMNTELPDSSTTMLFAEDVAFVCGSVRLNLGSRIWG